MPNTSAKLGQALTSNELAVLHHLVKGLTNQEIADELDVGLETVKAQIYTARIKTGTKNRVQLAVWFVTRLREGDG